LERGRCGGWGRVERWAGGRVERTSQRLTSQRLTSQRQSLNHHA
jgi:hypothetical protein